MMKSTEELKDLVNQYADEFRLMQEEEWVWRKAPDKWSRREILGHLIDSALTNQRRFVMSQYKQGQKIVYDQDQWVQLQCYQKADSQSLIDLWVLLNMQLIRIMEHIPENRLSHVCDTGKEELELRTIAFLIADYVEHLKHHGRQILG